MKRLFAIRNVETGKTLDEYFSHKHLAKRRRDELNGGVPTDENTIVRFVVTYGPDHRKEK